MIVFINNAFTTDQQVVFDFVKTLKMEFNSLIFRGVYDCYNLDEMDDEDTEQYNSDFLTLVQEVKNSEYKTKTVIIVMTLSPDTIARLSKEFGNLYMTFKNVMRNEKNFREVADLRDEDDFKEIVLNSRALKDLGVETLYFDDYIEGFLPSEVHLHP